MLDSVSLNLKRELKLQAIDRDAASMLKTIVQMYEWGETLREAVRQFFFLFFSGKRRNNQWLSAQTTRSFRGVRKTKRIRNSLIVVDVDKKRAIYREFI